MNHKEIIPLLDDYVLDRLTPLQAKAVQSHLDGCPACRRQAQQLEQLRDEIHEYFESPYEAPSTLWRERLRRGDLPPQKEGLLQPFLRRLQQILLPLAARPVPLLVSFLMGLLALPAAQRMGVRIPIFLGGVPVASASQSVPIFAQQRSAQADRVALHPDTEIMTFRMSVEGLMGPGGQEAKFRCQLSYQERIVADQVVPAIDGTVSFSVQAAVLQAGEYRLEWFEHPHQQGRKRSSVFELVEAGAARSPPAGNGNR